jgi:hypothetical protein
MIRATVRCLSCVLLFAATQTSTAQVSWLIGMRTGLSIGTGGPKIQTYNYFTGLSESSGGGTSAGFQFGPTAEAIFQKNLAVGTAININTQAGTPIEWTNYFKYYFIIPGSQIKPYADAGFSLYFASGGPYVSIPFGGGALFPIAKNLYIPADVQFGPIFITGSTIFGIAITSGIRYQF